MTSKHSLAAVLGRGILVTGSSVGLVGGAWALVRPSVLALGAAVNGSAWNSNGASFPTIFEGVAALAVLLALGWLVLSSALVSLEAATDLVRRPTRMRQRPGAGRWVRPRALYRLVLTGGATALAAGLTTSPALASWGPDAATTAGRHSSTPQVRLSGLPLPDRAAGHLDRQRASAWGSVTVRAGDSLWRLTQRLLPPGASAARVAAGCNQLHRTNRELVGTDPNLILPGTTLDVTALLRTVRKDRA